MTGFLRQGVIWNQGQDAGTDKKWGMVQINNEAVNMKQTLSNYLQREQQDLNYL